MGRARGDEFGCARGLLLSAAVAVGMFALSAYVLVVLGDWSRRAVTGSGARTWTAVILGALLMAAALSGVAAGVGVPARIGDSHHWWSHPLGRPTRLLARWAPWSAMTCVVCALGWLVIALLGDQLP